MARYKKKNNERTHTISDLATEFEISPRTIFGYSLDEIAEMIGMTDVNMSEAEQIEKSLAYGEKKLAEIRERIRELDLLQEDLLSVKERLLKSLAELKK
jgi:DNA-binding transcriptional MerR regulator